MTFAARNFLTYFKSVSEFCMVSKKSPQMAGESYQPTGRYQVN